MSDDKTNAAIERVVEACRGATVMDAVRITEMDALTLIDEVRRLRSLGIVELGAENPEVLEYMEHWETRAKKAEAATDMYAELNRGVAEALGLDPGHSWHDLPRQVRLALNEARSMAAATDRAEKAEAERDEARNTVKRTTIQQPTTRSEIEIERDEARADLQRFAGDVSDGFDCLPGCDSYAHEDLCPVTNPIEAWRQMRAEIERLRAEVERLRAALAEVSRWRELAHEHDKDMGHPAREFCDDVELIEQMAARNLRG